MPQHTKATITGVCQGVNTINTLRFMQSHTTLAAKQALAIEIRDQIIPKLKVVCAANMKFVSIVISVAEDPNDSPYALPVNIVGSGTLGPQQTACQFNLLTGQAGRRGRGRWYIGGVFTTAFVDGLFAGSTKTTLDTSVAALKAAYCIGGSSQYTFAVLSRANNALYAVADITYNLIPSSLRSRRLGVGI